MSETKEEVKQVVFGAISKDYLQKKLNELVEKNLEVFQEYEMLVNALKSELKMTTEDTPELVAQDANETE